MLNAQGRRLLWRKAEGFAASHCMKCAAGWTRTGDEGGTLTVCLLDREPVLTGLTNCDRFELKEPAYTKLH